MLGARRWSKKTKAVVATALVLSLLAPLGITQQAQPVVTGHSTFYNGNGFDPCLASVAGIMRTQVLWFNDQVLAERYGGKGTYVYVTENGSGDPRSHSYLYTDGTAYDFTDPNGAAWHIDEAFWAPDNVPNEQNNIDPSSDPSKPGGVTVSQDRYYVWIVELSAFPIHDQFAGSPYDTQNYHDVYNFLDIVDTCKFHRNAMTDWNQSAMPRRDGSFDFNITHDNSTDGLPADELTPAHGHPYGTKAHTHESFLADIWIGGKPVLVPLGATGNDAISYTSDWSQGGPAPTQADNAGTLPTSGGNPP
jgi:hypothetical protein